MALLLLDGEMDVGTSQLPPVSLYLFFIWVFMNRNVSVFMELWKQKLMHECVYTQICTFLWLNGMVMVH